MEEVWIVKGKWKSFLMVAIKRKKTCQLQRDSPALGQIPSNKRIKWQKKIIRKQGFQVPPTLHSSSQSNLQKYAKEWRITHQIVRNEGSIALK